MCHEPNNFDDTPMATRAIRRVCQECDYWDEDTGTCMESIDRTLCDCQFAKDLMIPELQIEEEEIDDDEQDDSDLDVEFECLVDHDL